MKNNNNVQKVLIQYGLMAYRYWQYNHKYVNT